MSKTYLLTYRDGSREHISRADRDSLLLQGLAKCTGTGRYLYLPRPTTCHLTATSNTLNQLATTPSLALARHFLDGSFIFELKGRRLHELLETPDALAYRITHPPQSPETVTS